jgi:lipopolysaccharide export system protein LptC
MRFQPLKRLVERLTIYLPMILMGLMALGTYWLVRSTPSFSAPAPAEVVSQDPDFVLEKFSIKTFDKTGRVKSELFGDVARHFPDRETVEVDHIKILSFNAAGQVSTATADKAITNKDSSEVQLIGNAVVVRDARTDASGQWIPRMSYRSDYLHAYMDDERITSNKPVELLRGQDRFTADSLDYSNTQQVLGLQGRVRGTLMPKIEP